MSTKVRRGPLFIALIVVVMSALLLSVGVSSPAEAQTTTTQEFSNTSSISIVDATDAGASPANPYPSQINIQGLNDPITDVNVKLNRFSHPFADDVAVQVVGPDGTSVLLMSDARGDVGVNSINLTLNDEAANSLFDEGQLTTGTYKPTKGTTPFCPPLTPSCLGNDPVPNIWPSPAPALSVSRSQLSGFDGKDPNGTWKLYVIDDGLFSAGTFAGGWSLEIDIGTTPPETAPTVTDTFPTGTNVERTTNVTAPFSE